MEFFAAGNLTRPIRLSEETRDFAYRSLMHEYGLDTRRVMAIPMDDVPHFGELSKLEQYDVAIGRIAAEAPIRICKGERLSGAATLGAAMEHLVPVTLDGKKLWGSISHLTVDFASVLSIGMNGIREKVEKAQKVHHGTEKEPFLRTDGIWRHCAAARNTAPTMKISAACPCSLPAAFMRRCRASGSPLLSFAFAATGPASAGSTCCWGIT